MVVTSPWTIIFSYRSHNLENVQTNYNILQKGGIRMMKGFMKLKKLENLRYRGLRVYSI